MRLAAPLAALLRLAYGLNAVAHSCRSNKGEERETSLKLLELLFHLRFTDAL